jgi:hypothetical protein
MNERPSDGLPLRAGSVRRAVAALALGLVAFLLIDLAVFRSGLYIRIAAPDSYAGQIYAHQLWSRVRPLAPGRTILVLGDSRVGQGFSARDAEALVGPGGPAFFSGVVAGATPRVMNYLLRQLDPEANRYALIAIELADFDDLAWSESFANRQLDLAFLPDVTGWSDCADLARSFPTATGLREALVSCLFKGYAYRRDVQDLLAAPLARLKKVRFSRLHGYSSFLSYGGFPDSLQDMRYDEVAKRLVCDAGVPEDDCRQMGSRLGNAGARADNRAYRLKWLGEITRRYAGSSTRLVLFQPPRGPFPAALRPKVSAGAVQELVASGRWSALDEHLFDSLERPEYFHDHVHLSAAGRKLFTEQLVRALLPGQMAANTTAGRGD